MRFMGVTEEQASVGLIFDAYAIGLLLSMIPNLPRRAWCRETRLRRRHRRLERRQRFRRRGHRRRICPSDLVGYVTWVGFASWAAGGRKGCAHRSLGKRPLPPPAPFCPSPSIGNETESPQRTPNSPLNATLIRWHRLDGPRSSNRTRSVPSGREPDPRIPTPAHNRPRQPGVRPIRREFPNSQRLATSPKPAVCRPPLTSPRSAYVPIWAGRRPSCWSLRPGSQTLSPAPTRPSPLLERRSR